MILQALANYYQRLIEEDNLEIAPEGFQKKEIPFIIILTNRGEFVDLEDTRTLFGKKLVGRNYLVPKEKERSGSKACQTANLLWDHYGYVFSIPKSDSKNDREMARKQHEAFIKNLRTLSENFSDDSEINSVYQFLSKGDFTKVFLNPRWSECRKIPGCNLSFRLYGQNRLICENENIREYIVSGSSQENGDKEDGEPVSATEGICLVNGEYSPIARLHPRTPILGKSKSNAKIVSFQKNMGFDSYGKLQSFNAPVSKRVAFAYTTALNYLLARDSRQKIQVGDSTMVFWAEKENQMENVFADIFGEPPKGQPEQDYKSLVALFRSPESGVKAELDPSTEFFILGLSPNAARIAVRFWYAGTVGNIANNIWQHFDDMEIVKGQKDWHKVSLRSLLRSTALLEKDDNIAPNLAGETMKAILNGTPYPQTLLSSVITRIKAEQSKKDNSGNSIQNVSYTRAALIKAILVRKTRFYNRNEKEVNMSLDITNTNPGYLLGRLFAVLEKTQENANPGINATIRDRFYGSASSTPVIVFSRLMTLNKHHIAKLENKGQVVNIERKISEIMDKLPADNPFPTFLSMSDQGRFAVGYYHQRQDLFTKKI